MVGEAGDGTTAVALAERRKPNVVIMDVRMPGMDGLEATRLITDRYHALIKAANPASVWLNYQLIGVQYLPVSCWGRNNRPCAPTGFQVGLEDPTNNGQPFYLANLVIETNWGLQNFQGVPPNPPYNPVKGFLTSPGTKPTDHYYPNKQPPGQFDRSLGNAGQSRRNRGQVFNMGGCMGCHGVAQALGTDFSFALLFGQAIRLASLPRTSRGICRGPGVSAAACRRTDVRRRSPTRR